MNSGPWRFVGVLVAIILVLFIIGLFVEASHSNSNNTPACPAGYTYNSATGECQYGY